MGTEKPKVILGSSEVISQKNDWISEYLVIPEELSQSEADPLAAVEKVYSSRAQQDCGTDDAISDAIFIVALFKEDKNKWDVAVKRPSIKFYDRQLLSDLSEASLKALVFKKIRFVIFDMDGLLLDTENIYTKAQQELLTPFGITFTSEAKCLMMGQKALDGAQTLIQHYNLEGKLCPEEFVKKRAEICDKLFPTCQLLPGVEKLLKHLLNHSIPSAVATGSGKSHFKLKTQSHEVTFNTSFNHIVTSDEVEKSKPDPEIFTLAASRFKDYNPESDRDSVLVFEDSPLGIDAANAAGFHSVLIETDYNKDSDVVSTQRLPSLCEFKPELWGLPPYS